jgi:alkanesulfonate monooxygenase SsuD/methylene tetrahydromethanopterin reductase-like flavin-dependent oxidoreductase (luciferase family)
VGAHVVRAHIQGYLEGQRAAGRVEDPSGWRVARSIFVADDEATARRYHAHEFYFHVMRTKLARGGIQEIMGNERLVIAGTPQSVADQILAFRREVGAFGSLLYTGHDWVDPVLARRSMELMSREVMPRVNAALRR